MKDRSTKNICCKRCKGDKINRNGFRALPNGEVLIKFICFNCRYTWNEPANNYPTPLSKQYNPACPQCSSAARKNGKKKSSQGPVQRYYCPNCRTTFQQKFIRVFKTERVAKRNYKVRS